MLVLFTGECCPPRPVLHTDEYEHWKVKLLLVPYKVKFIIRKTRLTAPKESCLPSSHSLPKLLAYGQYYTSFRYEGKTSIYAFYLLSEKMINAYLERTLLELSTIEVKSLY